MRRSLQVLVTLSIVIPTLYAVSLLAQEQAGQPQLKNTVEGTIQRGLSTENTGVPSFLLKTKEGTEYTIHLVTLKNAAGEVFAPKVGDTVSVVGKACCGMGVQTEGTRMLHAAEITRGSETYRAVGSAGCMMMGQGRMGQGQSSPGMQGMMMHQSQPGQGMQGMMMGHGSAEQGQPGQAMQGSSGMMMCPGMTGHTMSGQATQSPGQATPGATSCCGAGGCGGCMMQQAPAPLSDPEHEH